MSFVLIKKDQQEVYAALRQNNCPTDLQRRTIQLARSDFGTYASEHTMLNLRRRSEDLSDDHVARELERIHEQTNEHIVNIPEYLSVPAPLKVHATIIARQNEGFKESKHSQSAQDRIAYINANYPEMRQVIGQMLSYNSGWANSEYCRESSDQGYRDGRESGFGGTRSHRNAE